MRSSALARYLVNEVELKEQLDREQLPTGIAAFDAAFGGLPRGAVTEVWGSATSGKTTFLNHFLANATASGEFCALVDGGDTFDPASAVRAGGDLSRLLWVRCHGAEESLKATDLLVHAGGWGLVLVDLADVPPTAVRRIPISWWYRFRRAVERTPTVFLVAEREPNVKNCAVMALEFQAADPVWSGDHSDFCVLGGTNVQLNARKPVRARDAAFATRCGEVA